MNRYSVHFSDEAWQPLEAQVRYIAVQNQAPINASRWIKRLLGALESLFEKTYLILYTIDEEAGRVNIISFRHGAKMSE